MARPSKTEDEKVVTISATLLPKHRDRVAAYANCRRWSSSQTAGYLIELGLERLEQLQQEDAKQAKAA